jgi:two-component system OmpR family sensor kinase
MRRGIAPDYRPSDLKRLPIRWRIAFVFAGVMAVLLAGLIAFVYFHFRSDLDYNIDGSLNARAQEVASLVRNENAADTRGALGTIPDQGENFVQVLDDGGRVLGASAGHASPRLLSVAEIQLAERAPRLIERGNRYRLYAMPVQGGTRIVVAGVSLATRDAALDKLDDSLWIGVPPALVLASIAAYFLAAAALAPVERMRSRAALISTDEISTRLPLPEANDEIQALGRTLNAMLDRLEEGLNHERQFVANASHELRMPLAVLKAELEVALRERGSSAQLRAAMGSAIEETDRIVKLAEDLLLLARAHDGTLPLQPVSIAVVEMVNELAERFTPIAARSGRELIVDSARLPVDLSVRVDPDRVRQAISNLVDNSLRYGEGDVTLSAELVAGRVQLHVSDHGAGFDEALVGRAFDRFSRADLARGRGGVGLGLTIVRTIAEAHGGAAGAANLPHGGADVWIAIPLSKRNDHDCRPSRAIVPSSPNRRLA